jgi:hypothetical protein
MTFLQANGDTAAYGRASGDEKVIVVINKGGSQATVNFSAGSYASSGDTLKDLYGGSYTVTCNSGNLSVNVPANGVVILKKQ